MLQGSGRTMGLLLLTGLLGASLAWAEEPAAKGDVSKAAAPKKSAPAAVATDEIAILDTSKGRMVLEFWEKEAPQTVANFKKLARQGFFDGTGFHRIIKGFMIQGGDPKSKNPKALDLGTGDPGYKIKDEFNAHKHTPGVISMANSSTPNSAGSQFFIMHGAAPFLDGKYTAFGHLIEGINVLNDIANSPVEPNAVMNGEKSKPLEWTTLKTVKIVLRSSLTSAPVKTAEKAGAATKGTETKAKEAAPPPEPDAAKSVAKGEAATDSVPGTKP